MAPIYSDLQVHLRTDRSITQFMLENISNTSPGKIICEDTLTDKSATYGGLREESFRAAQSLRTYCGVRKGDAVSIISRSCVDYILAAHSIWAAGAVVSTINHSNTAEELAFALKLVKPKIIIVDATVRNKVDRAVELMGSGKIRTMTLLSRIGNDPLFPDDLLRSPVRVSPEAYVLDGQDARKECAAIVLSSGTTGSPKAVMLSHHNLIAICEMLRYHNTDNWRGDMSEVFFPVPSPLAMSLMLKSQSTDSRQVSHIYGLYVCALMGPWLGCYISLMHAFDMELFCKLLHEKRATLARLVPTVALALAESPIVSKYTYPDLEYFSCAGAVLKPNVAAKLRQKFPGVALCQSRVPRLFLHIHHTYGCTETSSCISQSGVRDKGAPLVATGTLLANIGIKFVDEQLQEVPAGTPGEICVACPTIMMGYKDSEKATRESMLEPGWYRTGDVGFLDSQGYLIIVDRIKDVIKYKGFQVSPTELEEMIGQHPQVEDVGVTSIWDDTEATELPRAFVVPRAKKGAPELLQTLSKEIQALVATKAAGYKKLRGGVEFVTSLPKNPTGKLLRRQLRARQAEGKVLAKL